MTYKFTQYLILLSALIFFSTSCANYKLNYLPEAKDWRAEAPNPADTIKHTLYLIGDTGNSMPDKPIKLFKHLKDTLAQASEESSIIFLGDNIYPVGMPSQLERGNRATAEHKLDVQIEMLKDYKGEIIFIPGNHDWMRYGLEGVNRQEKYLEKALNEHRNGTRDDDDEEWEEYFYPSDGCGDPKVIEVNDQLVIVLIDSQWWQQDWDSDQSINIGCDISTRAEFYRDFENIVRKYRSRNVVVAMHHPLYSNGQHGGNYTANQHLFPLRFLNKKLWVPMPGLGSAIAFFRSSVGVPQDLSNGKYKDMRNDIMAALTKNGSYIVASGHEHNLQYIEKRKQQFIVTGAGSKESPVKVGDGGSFGYARMGYAKIDFYLDGSAWLSYYAMNGPRDGVEEVFRKKIKEALELSEENIPDDFTEYDEALTTKVRRPSNYDYGELKPLQKAVIGEHYSDIYDMEFEFPVVDLAKFKGGMTPIKRGGGNQTNSLRLVDSLGQEYTMRALTKDVTRALPSPVKNLNVAKYVLENNFMAAYPFAALMVPDMAKSIEVYHTNPILAYVPKQPVLGIHNDLFGGDVYLIEERPDEDWSNLESFGNSSKIVSTSKVIQKITKSRKHRIDQPWVLRSRLFDLVIKDWDRHEDQWRWASFEDENGLYYRPIPRDRDQPFSKYDGVLPWIAYTVNPSLRQIQKFTPDTKNIKWQGWNATFFDNTFMSELDWAAWEKEANYIKEHLTDEVIDTAFARIPKNAQNAEWEQMRRYTKVRRDNILRFAEMAYRLTAQQVDVLGTSKRDIFEVHRLSDEQTRVYVYEADDDGKRERLVYDRTFDHAITKEIHLYGLEDKDDFLVTGDVAQGLLIRIVGGVGEDKIVDNSSVLGLGKKTFIYDSSEESNELVLGKESKDKTSNQVAYNSYNRRSFHYNPSVWLPFPRAEYNSDDGVIIGLDVAYIKNKFKKDPYGSEHRFIADYSFRTQAFNFEYRATYVEVLNNWDLRTDAMIGRNRYRFNYFGLGNDSQYDTDQPLDFNRVRQSRIYATILAQRRFAHNRGTFAVGPWLERTTIEETAGRFISSDNAGLPDDIFEDKIYTGLGMDFNYENVNDKIHPQKGFKFNMGYNAATNIENTDLTFGKFSTKLTIYQFLTRRENLVLASSMGYERIRGQYDFFQAPTIGGNESLRGYRPERFRGFRAFHHTTDVRVQFTARIKKRTKLRYGLHAGFDYGRVWQTSENADQWHYSYGGGIWVRPINFFLFSFGQYTSAEDSRFIFKLNHLF